MLGTIWDMKFARMGFQVFLYRLQRFDMRTQAPQADVSAQGDEIHPPGNRTMQGVDKVKAASAQIVLASNIYMHLGVQRPGRTRPARPGPGFLDAWGLLADPRLWHSAHSGARWLHRNFPDLHIFRLRYLHCRFLVQTMLQQHSSSKFLSRHPERLVSCTGLVSRCVNAFTLLSLIVVLSPET